MNFDDDTVVQDVLEEFNHLQLNNENEEIWYHENPEIDQNDHMDDVVWDEPGPFVEIKEVKQKPIKKFNLEFEATVYRYISSQDLALHDHDRKDLIEFTHRFSQSCFVYRYTIEDDVFIEFVGEEDAKMGNIPHQNAQVLFHIKLEDSLVEKNKKFFMIEPQKITEAEEKMFKYKRLEKRIYKCMKNKYKGFDDRIVHRLQKNDQIRFGLETYKISEIELTSSSRQNKKYFEENSLEKIDQKQVYIQKKLVQITCKICLSTDNDEKNPLLDPCECKGSCQHVHLACLRTWLDSNLEKQQDPSVDSYKWTKFECEICKTPYPLKVQYQGKLLRLADFEIPTLPYIVFERIRSGCRKQILVVKGFCIPVYIGRAVDCDIKIGMNSISRRHAVIEFESGQFYLRDLDSKYGTLIRINQPMRIEGKMKVQVGDVLIRFDLVIKKNGKEHVWKYD